MEVVRSLGCACAIIFLQCMTASATGLSDSPNFLVLGPGQETTDAVLKQAEKCRRRLAIHWLGSELPTGAGRTFIRVSSKSAETFGGFLPLDNSGRQQHRIRIVAPPGSSLDKTLAHEMAHLVMEVAFAGRLPVWANEGVAMSEDGPRLQDVRTAWIKRYARTGEWPKLKRVLVADRIRNDIEAYAVADYLTKYLLTCGDASTFFSFAIQGNRVGWDSAARQCYGVPLGQLQANWQSWAARTITGPQLLAGRHMSLSTRNH